MMSQSKVEQKWNKKKVFCEYILQTNQCRSNILLLQTVLLLAKLNVRVENWYDCSL